MRHRKPHMTRHTFVTEVYLHSSRTRTEAAVAALTEYVVGTVKPKTLKTRMDTGLKATTGLEPVYEALQASA